MTQNHPLFPLNVKKATSIVQGLSRPGKMPGFSYNTPASKCNTGTSLRGVKGSVCSFCYAMQNRYIWPNVQEALERRYIAFTKDPYWIPAMVYLLNKKAEKNRDGVSYPDFRWFDSGDIPDLAGLMRILSVVKLTPKTKHWLPTREKGLIVQLIKNGHKIPDNLVIRISMNMIGEEARLPKILQNVPGIETSVVNPESIEEAFTCPAPSQGNKCRDCRHCWSRSGVPTNYLQHGGEV